jgi:DNA-binding transcriptional regulator WhiA
VKDGSFTAEVVSEVAPHIPPAEHCRIAFLYGVGKQTSRLVTARAALSASHADGLPAHVETRHPARGAVHSIAVDDNRRVDLQRLCCKRAFVRGAFMSHGSLRRLDAPPHLEIPVSDDAFARELAEACGELEIPVRQSVRRGQNVLLVRSASGVAMFLSSIGAHTGRLEFEEARVVREVRGGVNRSLNSETANLRRTVITGMAQVEQIERIKRSGLWRRLPGALREAAELRTAAPSEPLSALARRAGCSRSAMAGRLRRLLALHSNSGADDNVPAVAGYASSTRPHS